MEAPGLIVSAFRHPCHPVLTPSSDVTSEESLIILNVYDRAAEDQGFLGTLEIKPTLIHDHTVDQWFK